MKIERQEKEFTPIVITIETREELEHLFAAVRKADENNFLELKNKMSHINSAWDDMVMLEIDSALFDCL